MEREREGLILILAMLSVYTSVSEVMEVVTSIHVVFQKLKKID
jgi:hypothetical protein